MTPTDSIQTEYLTALAQARSDHAKVQASLEALDAEKVTLEKQIRQCRALITSLSNLLGEHVDLPPMTKPTPSKRGVSKTRDQ